MLEIDRITEAKADGKRYKTAIREASYYLAAGGVAQKNISQTLKQVHRSLTGEELAGNLPSYATQNYMARNLRHSHANKVCKGPQA